MSNQFSEEFSPSFSPQQDDSMSVVACSIEDDFSESGVKFDQLLLEAPSHSYSEVLRDGLLRDLMCYLQAAAVVPEDYAMGAALFTLAGLVENRCRMIHDGNTAAHNALSLYLLLVGPARVARKSSLMEGHTLALIRTITGRSAVADATIEGIHEELFAGEKDSLTAYFDEFRTLIGSRPQYQQNMDAQITRMYNGNDWTRCLKSNKSGKTGSTLKTVDDYMVNVCGCTTLAWLCRYVQRDSFLSGFMARFLPVIANHGDPAIDLDINDEGQKAVFRQNIPTVDYFGLVEEARGFYDRLIGVGKRIFTINSPEANSFLAEYNRRMAPMIDDELSQAIFDGLRENIRRAAGLIALSHFSGDPTSLGLDRLGRKVLAISPDSMAESIWFCHKVFMNARTMLRDHLSDSTALTNARIILKDLLRHQSRMEWFKDYTGKKLHGFSKTTITRNVSVSGNNREQGLRELTMRGCLEGPLEVKSPDPQAKRPVQVYLLKQSRL